MTTWITNNKSSTSWGTTNKASTTFSLVDKTTVGQVTATAGLYYGFGCFTYAGGEILVAGHAPIYTYQNKT